MLLDRKYCYDCQLETDHYNGRCGVCLSKKAIAEQDAYWKSCESKTLEERVRSLEQFRYQLMKEHNEPQCDG